MKKNIKIGVIGLGYVGLPVSVLFSNKYEVVGLDTNKNRVDALNQFNDLTLEISNYKLENALNTNLTITNIPNDLQSCNFYIITVPTPIFENKTPDLRPLESATKAVGKLLSIGDIVVYESTVYPGCTEEFCVPILEKESSLKFNQEFYCGYSPERINPGDKEHTIDKIVKVTSGSTDKIALFVDSVYNSIISAGTFKASSIRVAEAAKVIENAQRDINIAFVNELSMIFNKIKIDTTEVLEAASTKWNFLQFKPGLVGGHCIGVDPYYLASKAIKEGFNPEIILAGRKVNDGMGVFIADRISNILTSLGKDLSNCSALVLGVSFKENCPDFRNTKVVDLIKELQKNSISVDIYDPWVMPDLFKKEYSLDVYHELPSKKYDSIVLAVSHESFKDLDLNQLSKDSKTVIYDIKSFYNKEETTERL